jgi:uncharacterized delta-60 repeat protein
VSVAPAKADPLTGFAAWTERFQKAAEGAAREALLPEGLQLARERRETLAKLIRTNPKRALEQAVPYRVRRVLPPDLVALLEQPVEGRGQLDVLGVVPTRGQKVEEPIRRSFTLKGITYRAYVYGHRLHLRTQIGLAIHGIAVDEFLAIHEAPARMLEPEEAADLLAAGHQPASAKCVLCGKDEGSADGQPTWVAIGGELKAACRPAHAREFIASLLEAEKKLNRGRPERSGGSGGIPPKNGTGSHTQGTKTLLYIRVCFPDDPTEPITESEAYQVMKEVNDFYETSSYHSTAIITTVGPLVTLPQPKRWYGDAGGLGGLMADAREATRAAGFDFQNYDLDLIRHVVVPGWEDWAGMGFVGARGVWLQSSDPFVAAHELGHNYGLVHANFWVTTRPHYDQLPEQPQQFPANHDFLRYLDPPVNNAIPWDVDSLVGHETVIGPGDEEEYGDWWDSMGLAYGRFPEAHFGAVGKWRLNWLPESSIEIISQSETNRLYAFDQPELIPGGTHALVIGKDAETDYWVSVRSRIANNAWVNNGVLLHWSSTEIGGDSVLLDTTRGTRQLRTDSALVVGRTFTDPEAQIHITPVARGVEGNTPWVDVVVHLGTATTNLPPTLELQAPSLRAQPGQPLQFTADVFDPNGDAVAYAWDFGDESFGANSPTVTKSWSAEGEYVVRCEVSDMRGGVTSLHRVVTIGSPPTLRISGRVLDQYGQPLQDVRVHNGALSDTMTIETNTHVFTYTDSEGRYSLVNLASSNSYTCGAYLRGYVTRPHNFLNPVTLFDVSAQDVDYLAQLIPLVSVTPASPASEAGLQAGAFTVSRIGPTNTVVVVPLTTAGSAEEGVDYETLPDVDFSQVLTNILTDANGNQLTNVWTNTITAPHAVLLLEGVRSTNVIITPLQDTNYETAESVVLLLERQERVVRDTNYFDPDLSVPGWDIVTTAGDSVWMLAEPDYYIGSPALAELLLTDDDPVADVNVSLEVLDDVAIENRNDVAVLVVMRDTGFSTALTVAYALAGSAVNGADYTALSGTITIPAGWRGAYLVIAPIDDLYVEGTETVEVTLQPGTGYTVTSSEPATVTIVDNDLPTVAIVATDSIASEPGSDVGRVTITRYGDLTRDLEVSYFVEGTATSGRDFAPLSGRVTIPAGAVSAFVTITPREDPLVEDDEIVTVFLADSTTYNIGNPASASVVILDNELPFISIMATDDAAAEPSDTAELRVVRTGSTAQALWVPLKLSGTAILNSDYAAIPNPVYIPAGASQVTLTVTPVDDAFREITEDLFVEVLPDPSYNLGTDSVAHVTISDDDSGNQPAVGFTLLSSQGLESVTEVHFSVSVSDYPGQDQGVTNLIYLVPGTATEGEDFVPFSSNLVIFPPDPNRLGPLVQDFTVTVIDDDLVEAPEIFSLMLTDLPPIIDYTFETNEVPNPDDPENPITEVVITTNLTAVPVFASFDVYRIHTYTILDNDTNTVTVTATDPLASETGPKPGLLSFVRTGSTNSPLTFRFQVTGTASSGSDFEPLGTQLTFPAGVSQLDVPVVPLDDPVVEATETIKITLISAEGGQIGQPSEAVVTLEDNDGTIEFSALAYRVNEGVGEAVATVRRSGDLSSPTSVDFVTTAGTAEPGTDYIQTSGTLLFAAGEDTQTIRVPIVDDSLVEPEETFGLLLQNPAGGAPLGGQNTAQVIIVDNDTSIEFASAEFLANENGTNATVTVRRTGLTDFEVSVGYVVTNGTATADADFRPRAATLTFRVGQTNATFLVPLIDDILMEGDETVSLMLTNAAAGAVLGPQATATLILVDDECAIEFDAPSYSVLEYAGAVSVVVRRVGGTVNAVSATYTTTNGTALAGRTEDYRAEAGTLQFAGDAWVPVPRDPGTLVFQKGETNKTITIHINDDTIGERNETFGVMLTQVRGPAQGARPGSAVLGSITNTTVTILDNELPGHVDYEFNPGLGADGPVYAVGLEPDGQVLLGGDFATVDGVFIGRVARLHPDGYLDYSFNPGAGADGTVLAVAAVPGGRIYLGGEFNRINQVARRGLARLNEDGTLDDAFTTTTDDAVRAFAVQANGTVLLGGDFTTVGGLPLARVARLTADGQVDSTFAPSGGANGTVFAVASQPDGKVVIAGDFSTVNGQNRSGVARLQADGSLDPGFAPTPDGPVRSLALQSDGKMVIAGAFGNVGATPRAGVARLNPDGSLDTSFILGAGANDLVRSVAVSPGGRIIVGGDFTLFNGQVMNRFARLNSDGTVDPTFDMGSGANGPVHAVVAQADTATVIGGEFTRVRDVARNRIARIHGEEAFSSGIIQFSAATYTVPEAAGSVLISVFRTGNTKDTVAVDFSTADGTATAGADYEATSGTLTFAPGETLKTFEVVILDDTIGEGNETVALSLAGIGNATLVIVDDESAVAFSAPTYEVSETAGSAVITVKRTGNSTDSFSVDYTVTAGTATAGADFVAADGTLTFAPGETDKTFSVAILNDEEIEEDETVQLTLLNPTGGVALGSQRTALLTIHSEDQAATSYFLNITPPLGGTVTPPSGAYPTNSIQTVVAIPELNFEFVRWEGSILSDTNLLVLTMTNDYNLTARFRLTQPTYTFEPPFADLELTEPPWANTPSAPWRLQTATAAGGEVAVRSGLIGDNQQSTLELRVDTRAGTASFDVRVSTEPNWDYLEFYLNGVRLQRWSGEVDWRPYLFSVPAGANRLQWRFIKDANFSSGLDAAFIDNLYVPIDTTVPPDAAARLSVQMAANGVAQIGLSGKAGYTYVLQSSSDLSIWTGISTNVAYSGVVLISDPQSTNHPYLYYRAVAR